MLSDLKTHCFFRLKQLKDIASNTQQNTCSAWLMVPFMLLMQIDTSCYCTNRHGLPRCLWQPAGTANTLEHQAGRRVALSTFASVGNCSGSSACPLGCHQRWADLSRQGCVCEATFSVAVARAPAHLLICRNSGSALLLCIMHRQQI